MRRCLSVTTQTLRGCKAVAVLLWVCCVTTPTGPYKANKWQCYCGFVVSPHQLDLIKFIKPTSGSVVVGLLCHHANWLIKPTSGSVVVGLLCHHAQLVFIKPRQCCCGFVVSPCQLDLIKPTSGSVVVGLLCQLISQHFHHLRVACICELQQINSKFLLKLSQSNHSLLTRHLFHLVTMKKITFLNSIHLRLHC